MGLNDQEIVALSGAHTLGRGERTGWPWGFWVVGRRVGGFGTAWRQFRLLAAPLWQLARKHWVQCLVLQPPLACLRQTQPAAMRCPPAAARPDRSGFGKESTK